jgi:hypothetical protein
LAFQQTINFAQAYLWPISSLTGSGGRKMTAACADIVTGPKKQACRPNVSFWAISSESITIPIMGMLLQFARGNSLPVFGLLDIVSPWAKDRALVGSLKEIHETLANFLMIVALARRARPARCCGQ